MNIRCYWSGDLSKATTRQVINHNGCDMHATKSPAFNLDNLGQTQAYKQSQIHRPIRGQLHGRVATAQGTCNPQKFRTPPQTCHACSVRISKPPARPLRVRGPAPLCDLTKTIFPFRHCRVSEAHPPRAVPNKGDAIQPSASKKKVEERQRGP